MCVFYFSNSGSQRRLLQFPKDDKVGSPANAPPFDPAADFVIPLQNKMYDEIMAPVIPAELCRTSTSGGQGHFGSK